MKVLLSLLNLLVRRLKLRETSPGSPVTPRPGAPDPPAESLVATLPVPTGAGPVKLGPCRAAAPSPWTPGSKGRSPLIAHRQLVHRRAPGHCSWSGPPPWAMASQRTRVPSCQGRLTRAWHGSSHPHGEAPGPLPLLRGQHPLVLCCVLQSWGRGKEDKPVIKVGVG